MNMTNAASAAGMLDAVRIRSAWLQEARKRYADQLAPSFHLVDHLRNDELALSRYLALLLDVEGAHSQGALFLRNLVERLGPCASWIDPKGFVSVTLEKRAGGLRRLDIYLVFKNGVLGIENKPWAGDQPEQLKDYAGFLTSAAEGGNWLLVYACNGEPSEGSIASDLRQQYSEDGRYCRFDFYQLAEWLEYCACFARAPKVRLFIEELSGYIRREINGELEMTEADEIKSLLLERNEYIESAFQVAASLYRVKEQLLADLKDGLGSALLTQGMALIWDDVALKSGRRYAGFGVLLQPEHKAHLRFEFERTELNSLEWGIYRDASDTTLETAKAVSIREAMTEAFGAGHCMPAWPWYPGQGPEDTVLAANERNWGVSGEPWLRIRDTSERGFVSRIVALAADVKKALAEVDAALY